MGDLTDTESDAALVVRAQHGDPEAFGRLPARPGTWAAPLMQNCDHDSAVLSADEVHRVRERVE